MAGGSGFGTMFGGVGGIDFLSTGNTQFFGNLAANGSDTVVGETGGSETMGGNRSDVVVAGTSKLTLVSQGGSVSINGGNGNDTIVAGTGKNTMSVAPGRTGSRSPGGLTRGTEMITDFSSSGKLIQPGYGAGEVASALATATPGSGGTTITLAENTRVTFLGSPTLNTSNVCGFSGG